MAVDVKNIAGTGTGSSENGRICVATSRGNAQKLNPQLGVVEYAISEFDLTNNSTNLSERYKFWLLDKFKGIYFQEEFDNGSISGANTINWDEGNQQKVTLSANATLTFEGVDGAANYVLRVVQGSGGQTITWPAEVLWPSGVTPTLSTGAGDIDVILFYYDGTNYYGQPVTDFS